MMPAGRLRATAVRWKVVAGCGHSYLRRRIACATFATFLMTYGTVSAFDVPIRVKRSVSEGDSVKKAKRKLGEMGSGESTDVSGTSPGTTARDDFTGTGESVESMLREFGSAGPEAPATGDPRRGKYDQLWQLSMADPHTGLANQLLVLDRLTQALVRHRRHGGEVVVCHVGLDNLGEINLDLGYTVGNSVLSEMARRLTSVIRAEDTIGRVGGSELVVILTVTDEQVVGPVIRRLQHTLDEPVVVGGRDIRLQASLGVAVAEDAESAEDLLARADRSTRVSRR
jgi:diguanylate cyclase (GGDEF)-like protein